MNKPPRPAQLTFIQALLSIFIFLVFFTALVAYGLRVAETAQIVAVAGGLIALCLVAIRLAAKGERGRKVSIVLGTLAHILLIVVFLLPGMWFTSVIMVGAVFFIIWVVAITMGAQIDRERAERLAHSAGE